LVHTVKTKEPKRLKGVPKEAVFNKHEDEWELGKTDRKGKRVGEWKYWWVTTGHHCGTSFYENGGKKETRTRFHPDGTYSQKGIFVDGSIMPGTTFYMQKSRTKTTELALQIPEYKNVFRMEELYIRKGLSRWKNFNAKGQRIDLDGDLLLTPEDYANNFPGFDVPNELVELVEFQNQVGAECYSDGFALGTDDKSFLKLWSKRREFLANLMFIADANGTGSDYFFWNHGASKTLDKMPVVIFGDEGGVHVVASNLSELLQILSYDVEPMVSLEGVDFTKCDYEPRPAIRAFRKWLKETCGITKPRKPDQLVKRAQATYKPDFDAWTKKFVRPD